MSHHTLHSPVHFFISFSLHLHLLYAYFDLYIACILNVYFSFHYFITILNLHFFSLCIFAIYFSSPCSIVVLTLDLFHRANLSFVFHFFIPSFCWFWTFFFAQNHNEWNMGWHCCYHLLLLKILEEIIVQHVESPTTTIGLIYRGENINNFCFVATQIPNWKYVKYLTYKLGPLGHYYKMWV
jgi:hypothetical protein